MSKPPPQKQTLQTPQKQSQLIIQKQNQQSVSKTETPMSPGKQKENLINQNPNSKIQTRTKDQEEFLRRVRESMNNFKTYIHLEKDKLKTSVGTGGISIFAILMSKSKVRESSFMKDGKSQTMSSQTFSAFVGSIDVKDIEPDCMDGSAVVLEVHPPKIKDSTSKDDSTQKMRDDNLVVSTTITQDSSITKFITPSPDNTIHDTTDEHNQHQIEEKINTPFKFPTKFKLHAFNIYTFSTNNPKNLEQIIPGDLVIISGIKAQASLPSIKYPVPTTFLNASDVKNVQNITLCDIYKMSSSQFKTSKFEPCTVKYNENDPSTRFARDSKTIVIKNPYTDDDLFNDIMYGNSLVVTQIDGNLQNWVFTKIDKSRHPWVNLSCPIKQWEGKYNEENVKKIWIDVIMYEDVLAPFCIKDLTMWANLAPFFFQNLSGVIIGIIDVMKTSKMFAAVNSGANEEIKFALQLVTQILIIDVPALYRNIGIPVTKEFVKKKFSVGGFQNGNPVSFPPVICMNETQIDKQLILSQTNVEFRFVIACLINQKNMEYLKQISPEEGDELYRYLSGDVSDTNNLKISKNSKVHHINLSVANNTVIGYIFALFDTKLDGKVEETKKLKIEEFIRGSIHEDVPNIQQIEYTDQQQQLFLEDSHDQKIHTDQQSQSKSSQPKKMNLSISNNGVQPNSPTKINQQKLVNPNLNKPSMQQLPSKTLPPKFQVAVQPEEEEEEDMFESSQMDEEYLNAASEIEEQLKQKQQQQQQQQQQQLQLQQQQKQRQQQQQKQRQEQQKMSQPSEQKKETSIPAQKKPVFLSNSNTNTNLIAPNYRNLSAPKNPIQLIKGISNQDEEIEEMLKEKEEELKESQNGAENLFEQQEEQEEQDQQYQQDQLEQQDQQDQQYQQNQLEQDQQNIETDLEEKNFEDSKIITNQDEIEESQMEEEPEIEKVVIKKEKNSSHRSSSSSSSSKKRDREISNLNIQDEKRRTRPHSSKK